jgi:hypothetical protein
LTLRAGDGSTAKLAGALGAGKGRCAYRGAGGKAKVAEILVEESLGEPIIARIEIAPETDARGRIGGAAVIDRGAPGDSPLQATLRGKLARGKLTFTVGSGPWKLSFRGTRDGDAFRGTLRYALPPARGAVADETVDAAAFVAPAR